MARIKGMKVTLIDKVANGTDPFGHQVYEDKEVIIDNVLVAPTAAADVVSQLNLTGKRPSTRLRFPRVIRMSGRTKKFGSLVSAGVFSESRWKALMN
ncbi:phage protein [Lacticaseibacillus rhamnosus MTCC 5462]|nr:phage protein [Lacticaseibacillus rhamnosus MTCC 5462]